jgi:hypothetical protein
VEEDINGVSINKAELYDPSREVHGDWQHDSHA